MILRVTVLLLLLPLFQGCAALVVGGGAASVLIAKDPRSAGSLVDDQLIEVKSGASLREDPLTKPGRIIVSSYNGLVLLAGEVSGEEAKARAADIVRAKANVKNVVNELHIGDTPPLGARSKDAWIATRAKAELLTAEGHPGLKIKVTVDRGVAYLQGMVSRDDGDWAATVVSNLPHVHTVVKVFEYP